MATSGTVTWQPEVQEIITEACERCGVDPTRIDRKLVVTARRSLNLMFSEWAVRGINYWLTTETTLALSASTRVYVLPAGTLDILDAVVRRGNSDTEMARLSLSDYNSQPNKTTTGLPINFFFDRQATPQIYVWPLPENSTDTIVYWRLSRPEAVTLSQQEADVPFRWNDALCAGLASRISMKIQGVPDTRITILAAQAESSFNYAATEEGEKAALKIIPAVS
tara:strand:- start:1253 stop:1921 length:669 start_codon:yes stop_codon:yes gene_type:complete